MSHGAFREADLRFMREKRFAGNRPTDGEVPAVILARVNEQSDWLKRRKPAKQPREAVRTHTTTREATRRPGRAQQRMRLENGYTAAAELTLRSGQLLMLEGE